MSGLAANPKFDEAMQDVAYSLAERIIDIIAGSKKAAYEFIMQVRGRGYAEYVLEVQAPDESVEELRRFGIPQRLEFIVIFAEYTGGAYAGFTARTQDQTPKGDVSEAIIINALPRGSQMAAFTDPEQLVEKTLGTMRRNPDVILHEVTHLLDHLRGTRSFAERSSRGEMREARSAREYVSSPHEFNAFFQQGMFQLRAHLEDMSSSYRRRVMSTFENFKSASNEVWAFAQLRRDARPKWIRKLDVRLYQHWEMWKEADARADRLTRFLSNRS